MMRLLDLIIRFVGVPLGVVALLMPPLAAAQPFSMEFFPNELGAFNFGSIAWADADGDGLLDVLMTGAPEPGAPYTPTARVYLNRGQTVVPIGTTGRVQITRRFEARGLPFGLWRGDAAWTDADHDGDLDAFVIGATVAAEPFAPTARLLRNDGGSFSAIDVGIPGLHSGSVEWGDYDNDGDADLLLTGTTDAGPATFLYRNDAGAFTAVESGLTNVAFGRATWGDYDKDGDLDVLLSGVSETVFVTEIYRNDGGAFTRLGLSLEGLAFCDVGWGDFDADGDLDVVVAGGRLDPRVLRGILRIYRNVGNDLFGPLFEETGGFLDGGTDWGDYDNDGDLDLVVVGALFPDGPRTARLYANQNGQFVHAANLGGTLFGDAAWADVDADDDLDLALNGLASRAGVLGNLYRNVSKFINTPPEPPDGLTASAIEGGVRLGWNAATDDQTASGGLTYNLRVGTAPGGIDVLPPLADAATGRRRVVGPGNAFHNTAWTLRGLTPGTYFWSVQAVDASFIGSAFAAEGSFTVQASGGTRTAVDDAVPAPAETLAAGYPNPFRTHTTIGYTLAEAASVRLAVYDLLGRRVRLLVEGRQPAGAQTVGWDGADAEGRRVAPGVYLYRLETGDGRIESRTLTVLR